MRSVIVHCTVEKCTANAKGSSKRGTRQMSNDQRVIFTLIISLSSSDVVHHGSLPEDGDHYQHYCLLILLGITGSREQADSAFTTVPFSRHFLPVAGSALVHLLGQSPWIYTSRSYRMEIRRSLLGLYRCLLDGRLL